MDISFPASRSCLWDERPTGEKTDVHLTSSGWIQLKMNSNVVDMAIQHSSRQSCDSEAWLMATPAVTKNNCIVIEINRFDPGKWVKNSNSVKLHPTIVLPGDIAIHCKVVDRSGSGWNSEGLLTHNMGTLQDAFSLLDQRIRNASLFEYHHLLSLRVIIIKGDHHRIIVKGGCVLPGTLARLHPLPDIPLLPVSLSRNLTSSNSLSSLQATVRVGYLSMDRCRKLVPLLPSDDCVHSLPLVGVWVSGATGIDHPVIWSTCLHYFHTESSVDRVYGSDRSCLVLLPGRNGSQLWQCSLTSEKWEWHTGESTLQLSGMASSLELMPSVKGTAAMTLLDSSVAQWRKRRGNVTPNDSIPSLAPAPRPVSVPSFVSHDSDLSCVSAVDLSQIKEDKLTNKLEPSVSSKMLQDHQKQLEALQEQVQLLLSERGGSSPKEVNIQTTPTNNASTNTGKSLLEGLFPVNYDSLLPEESKLSNSESSLVSNRTNSSGTLTPPISPPTASSITSTSILSRNLTSPEYSYSSSAEKGSEDEEVSSCIKQQLIYSRLKSQIEELLGESCQTSFGDQDVLSPEPVLSDVSNLYQQDEPLSFINVPRIKFTQNDFSQLSEVTLDSQSTNTADIITQRYMGPAHTPSSTKDCNSITMEYSTATRNYLAKHGLCNPQQQSTKILDIERLRNIPKLM